jgi:hypothetical protein
MDKLEEIFDRQRNYLRSLKDIYQSNGVMLHAIDPPWNLNGREEQEEFRLLAWRYTEELIEAAAEADPQKYVTEMADALHFLVEIAIYAGITPGDIYQGPEYDWQSLWDECQRALYPGCRRGYGDLCNIAIQCIGTAMCLLKQRSWRTDHRPTDQGLFRYAYNEAFYAFIMECVTRGITAQALYDAFFAKAKINDQRTSEQK